MPDGLLMRVAVWLAALLTSGLMAGCSDSGASQGDGSAEDEEAQGVPGLLVPEWKVGDWWTYAWDGGGATFIVTEDLGDAWLVDVDDAGVAFSEAVFDDTPSVGPVRKADLNGEEAGERVVHFDWPLVDGKSWSTPWDGRTWDVTAKDLGEGRFLMTATVQGEPAFDGSAVRTYTYDEALRWTRDITAFDVKGTEIWSGALERSGSGYTGAYVRWTIHDHVERSAKPGTIASQSFQVPEGAQEIWYHFTGYCDPDGLELDQGTYTVDMEPSGEPQPDYFEYRLCPDTLEDQGVLEPERFGEWVVNISSTGGTVTAVVVSRTLESFSL